MTPDPEDSEAEPGTESQAGSPFKGGKPHVHNGVEVSENMEGDDSRIIMDRAVPFIQKAAQAPYPA